MWWRTQRRLEKDLGIAWDEMARLRSELFMVHDSLGRAVAERDRYADLINEPAKVTNMLEKAGVIDVQHWAVKALVNSFAETLGPAPNFISMEAGVPDTDRWYEVTIRRATRPTISSRLIEYNDVIRGLLDTLNAHGADPHNVDDPLFLLFYTTDQQIMIKRALEILAIQTEHKNQKEPQ